MNSQNRRGFLKVVGATAAFGPLLVPGLSRAGSESKGKKFEGSLKGTKWEGIETTNPSVRQPYFIDESWEKGLPAYMGYNRVRADNEAKRSDRNLIKHNPRIAVAGNRAELKIDFKNDPPHPHAAGHWWSWIELWDRSSEPTWIFIYEPAEGEATWGKAGLDFRPSLFLHKPLKGKKLRVRAYCVTHGLYTKYYEI